MTAFPWWALGIALAVAALANLGASIWNHYVTNGAFNRAVVAGDKTAVLLGHDLNGRKIFMKQRFRTLHTQVIGTTSAGKTESVILPWAIQDIQNGSGLIIIDGKADRSFVEKLYAYACLYDRQKDFRFFSLGDIARSQTFNPLIGGSAHEICERVFSSFKFENEYYKSVQYKVFSLILRSIIDQGKAPTFRLIYRLLTDDEALTSWNDNCRDGALKREVTIFLLKTPKDRDEQTSGLAAALGMFCFGESSTLFNSDDPIIRLDDVLSNHLICCFQLPTMLAPALGEATGRLLLQSLQASIARRHLRTDTRKTQLPFISVFLDDFQDFIHDGFGTLLNKSRSANVGMVFSHQALGDLDKVSPAFRNIVITNTNVKCIMRTSEPESAEFLAKVIGTRTVDRSTERQKRGFLGRIRTGDESVRSVEEFTHHPNEIKSLGLGEGIVTIPHPKGIKTVRLKFLRRPDLEPIELPVQVKAIYEIPIPPPAPPNSENSGTFAAVIK